MSTPLFFEDRRPASPSASQPSQPNLQVTVLDTLNPSSSSHIRQRAVWEDQDEIHRPVNIATVKRRRKLRTKHAQTHVTANQYLHTLREHYQNTAIASGAWAQLKTHSEQHQTHHVHSEDHEDHEEFAQVAKLLKSTPTTLATTRNVTTTGILDIKPLYNLNAEDPCRSEARCLDFDSTGRFALTAGLDKTLRIFQVDGIRNKKIHGIHIRNFPIQDARFTSNNTRVMLAGRRKFFYDLDLQTGNLLKVTSLVTTHQEKAWERFEVDQTGKRLAFLGGKRDRIVILSAETKTEIGQIRVKGGISDVKFGAHADGEHELWGITREGMVCLWDVRMYGCVDKHRDEGAVRGGKVTVAGKWYATGTSSGVVNVYERDVGMGKGRNMGRIEIPKKSFFNLTTDINVLEFNKKGTLLVMGSHEKKDALRIADIEGWQVVKNWPTRRANVRRVCCARFSGDGQYLGVGNDNGVVRLMGIGQ